MAAGSVIRLVAGLLLGGLGACSGAHERRDSLPARTTAVPMAAVLNLPALVGSRIGVLQQQLGPAQPLPAAAADSLRLVVTELGEPQDSLVSFRRATLKVIAAYNPGTGQVSELFLPGHSEEALMQQAQLTLNAPGYIVLPVFQARQASQLLGLRIIAQKI